MSKVWLLTTGSGDDGDDWNLIAIYSSLEKANAAKIRYEMMKKRPDGSSYYYPAQVEEVEVL